MINNRKIIAWRGVHSLLLERLESIDITEDLMTSKQKNICFVMDMISKFDFRKKCIAIFFLNCTVRHTVRHTVDPISGTRSGTRSGTHNNSSNTPGNISLILQSNI